MSEESKPIGMSLSARLKRTALVSLAACVSLIAGYLIAKALAILIVLSYFPFSGGSGRGLDFFMNRVFAPVVTFYCGGVVFGGVTAIVSAIFASNRLWFKTIATVGVFGGVLTVASPPLQHWLAAQGAPARTIVESLLETKAENEKGLAMDFVKQNEAVMREAGGIEKVGLVSYTTSKNGSAVYYDISVVGTRTVYAIVEPSKNDGTSHFRLACTTPIDVGQRDPFKHPCKQ